MAWLAAVVDDVPRAAAQRLAEAMWAAGAQGVQEEPASGLDVVLQQPWDDGPPPPPPPRARLTAWFEDPDAATITAAIRAQFPGAEVTWTDEGTDVDWETAWQQGFEVLRVGPVTIAPPWEAVEDAIVIDPGRGFGTGAHATTRQALRLLVEVLTADPTVRTVLDIGTGSGLLALAAAKLGREAHGVDIAPEAIEEARLAAAHNGLAATFDTTPVSDLPTPHDLVVANVHAEALRDMAASLSRLARHQLIVAGVLLEKEAWVRDALEPTWGPPVARDVQEDAWVALWWSR